MATILIVDDLSANRRFLGTLLQGHGHRLLEATNGRDGLAVTQSERPDLVITDVLMPVMDGYEFVRRLRLDPAVSRTPVLFFTAQYGEREARTFSMTGGLPFVLRKPADPQEVLKIVGSVLSGDIGADLPQSELHRATTTDREHLRLLTDRLSETAEDLRSANARLRALINIALEFASERETTRRLESLCLATSDLFGATYVTLGILDRRDRTVELFVASGAELVDCIKTGDAVSGLLATVVTQCRTVRGQMPFDESDMTFPSGHPEAQAVLAAPIASPAHVYGWMCLVNNEGRSFTEEDEQLILALAGQVGRIYELEHEILDRKRAEVALGRERDRAQRYLDTAEVILVALDLDGRITLLNRKGCDLLGWSEPELIGRDWAEACLPVRMRDSSKGTTFDSAGDVRPVHEHPILTRSGAERLIEWRNTLLRDADGHVLGSLSSGADVTDREQAVEALRAAEERMRFALQSANVGIWDLDYATGVLSWSETLEAHYGLKRGTFGGTFEAFIDCVHPDDRELVLETVGRAMQSGEDFSMQHRSVWPDGTVRWLSGVGRIHLDENGTPVRGVGISLDITKRHTLEARYQQAQKMEAIGRLAGGIAHDFNNLLTAILGYRELLLADLDLNDPHRPDIVEIRKAGGRAAGLTRQFLAFNRKEFSETTVFDLNELIVDALGTLRPLIGPAVILELNLRPDPALARADRGQIEQVVMNLALNARDAMPGGGTLTIETACVDQVDIDAKTATTPRARTVLTVTDTGTGMTPEVQARLFEPFFTTKIPGKGTGLGLATVHSIVTRSGGHIAVDTKIGRGTSFKVYLPTLDTTVVGVEAPLSAAPVGVGKTVLVVEDEDGLRSLIERQLLRQGYRVLVAADGHAALLLVDEHPAIDVLLADVVMPGLNGPEWTRQVSERRPEIRVIHMSGGARQDMARDGILAPDVPFLHKPFTADALGRKIREVLA